MAELKANLGPYNLEVALASDRANGHDCFILDVGRNDNAGSVASLRQVGMEVDNYVLNARDSVKSITKLYIVGKWRSAQANKEHSEIDIFELEQHVEEVSRFSMNLAGRNFGSKAVTKFLLTSQKQQDYILLEQEWCEASEQIVKLILQMSALKELTYVTPAVQRDCIANIIKLDFGDATHELCLGETPFFSQQTYS